MVAKREIKRRAAIRDAKPHAVETPKETQPQSPAATLTPREVEEIEKRKPLRNMIEEGKDKTEATLLFTMMRIVDDINFDLDDSRYERKLGKEARARRFSLRHNADEVLEFLIRRETDFGTLHPKATFCDPTFAEYWHALRAKVSALQIAEANIGTAADWLLTGRKASPRKLPWTKRGLKKDLDELWPLIETATEAKLQLFLLIGFCLGIRSHRKKIQDALDPIKLDLIREFTIEKPTLAGPAARR